MTTETTASELSAAMLRQIHHQTPFARSPSSAILPGPGTTPGASTF
jgi:hypothetical protein